MTLWDPSSRPADLSIDFGDVSTITFMDEPYTTRMALVADKSGNGRDAVAQSTYWQRNPLYEAYGVDGLGLMNPDGLASFVFSPVDMLDKFVFVLLRIDTTDTDYILSSSAATANPFISCSGGDTISIGKTTDTAWNDTVVATTGITQGQYMLMCFDGDSAEGKLYIDGTLRATGGAESVAMPIDTIAVKYNSDGRLTGRIAQIHICDNTEDRARLEGYFLWRWGLEANLDPGHPYKLAAPEADDPTTTLSLDQPCALLAFEVAMVLDQPMAMLHAITMDLDQPVGMALQMELNQPCGDAATITLSLDQWARGLQSVTMELDQPLGVMSSVTMALDQPVVLPQQLTLSLDQPVVLAGKTIAMALDQPVQLTTTSGPVSLSLDQPVSLGDNASIKEDILLSVSVGGRVVDPDYVSVRIDDQDGFISSTIRFPDYEQYVACAVGEPVVIAETVNGGAPEITYLEVETLTNPEETGAADHIITAISSGIALDGESLTEDFGPGTVGPLMVALCGRYGIALDWQGVENWPVLEGDLVAAEETPYAVLRKVATASGAFLQPTMDGDVRLLQEYPLSVALWPSATDFVLDINDQDHILSIADQADARDGYNAFLISGVVSASDQYTLTDEAISATVKEVRCYMVPWDAGADIWLGHTGGDWVSVDLWSPASSPAMELIENEEVEIIAGLGATEFPIDSLVLAEYKQDSLGLVTGEYDGTIATATVGDALLVVSYWTKYMKWMVTDPRAESLQIYIDEVA